MEQRQIRRRSQRNLIEQTPYVDVRELKRGGKIAPDSAFVLLCMGGRSETVRLAHLVRPVFGGIRTYFCCPRCDSRCDLLYVKSSLACRRCHDLAFASENETPADRALRKLIKRRKRLGQTKGGVAASFPCKPKWWRWPRYLRIRQQALQQEREHWGKLGARLAQLERGQNRR